MTADLSTTTEVTSATDQQQQQQFSAKPGQNAFTAANLALKAQKKIASKLSNRSVTKLFITDTANRLLDDLLLVLKEQFPKKDAEKVIKNIIKLAVKIALLAQNNILSPQEESQLDVVQRHLHSLALTVISFHKVAYSYERSYYVQSMTALKDALSPLVVINLSDKSAKRLDHVFDHFMKPELSDALFKVNGPHKTLLSQIIADLEKLLEEKVL